MEKKVFVITGAAQGIGLAAFYHFLGSGNNVAVLDSDMQALKFLSEKMPSSENFLLLECDVSDESQVNDAVLKITEKFSSVDVLVNNAAINIVKKITELSKNEWDKVIGTNLTGIFLTVKYLLPIFRNGCGKIINICSTRAFQSEADTEAYSASKGGVFSLTHSLAASLGPNILVNSISPGWINTEGFKHSINTKIDISKEDHLQHSAGRVGIPKDIVEMIDYLSSDKADFITGQNFIIDGGMTKKMIYI